MTAEIVLVRHAKIKPIGRLCGRTDCDIRPLDLAKLQQLRPHLASTDIWLGSPAKRCQQSFSQLFPNRQMQIIDERLWEQDFGDWEGTPYGELPDIGELSDDALLHFRPPNGESFFELYQRVSEVLDAYSGLATGQIVGIMAHAGVIRAALGYALNRPSAGLKFMIDELSITRISVAGNQQFAIKMVNRTD